MRLICRYAVTLLLFLFVAGCASTADKNIAYRESRPASPLKIPTDLDAPATDQRLEVPDIGTHASASDLEVDVKPPTIIPAQTEP